MSEQQNIDREGTVSESSSNPQSTSQKSPEPLGSSDPREPQLQVICYHGRLFPAHWSFWVCDPATPTIPPPHRGKRVHVTGDLRNGFKFEIHRNHDISTESRRYTIYDIGDMRPSDLSCTSSPGQELVEQEPNLSLEDRFEMVAWSVRAPGPSTRQKTATVEKGAPRTKIEVRNCQWWIKKVVQELVDQRLLDETALHKVDAVPLHYPGWPGPYGISHGCD